jgi:multiple sugar transport system permease protein
VAAPIVVAAVMVFPWLFTLHISVHNRKVSAATSFAGMANDAKSLVDDGSSDTNGPWY